MKTMDSKTIDPTKLLEIRGKEACPRENAKLPSGDEVLCRGLTSQEYGRLQNEIRDEDGVPDWEAAGPIYCVYGVLKADSSQAYTMKDVGKLYQIPRALLQPMVNKILDLTGVTEDSIKRLSKNWSTMTDDDCSSDSPAISE